MKAKLLKWKYRLTKVYFNELNEKEQEVHKTGEADYQERRTAHNGMLQGGLCNADELAE
jgi:hypothetical protein